MLQSFGNDAGFILEIPVINNGLDKNPSVIYSGSSPGHTSTDSARPEQDSVHGLKACVNFIGIGTYQPVISFPVTDGRKFRNELYVIYDRIVPQLIVYFFLTCLTTIKCHLK